MVLYVASVVGYSELFEPSVIGGAVMLLLLAVAFGAVVWSAWPLNSQQRIIFGAMAVAGFALNAHLFLGPLF